MTQISSTVSERVRSLPIARVVRSSIVQGIVAGAAMLAASSSMAADCWTKVGAEFRIDPLLLYSIAKVESSLNPKAMNRNRNGTYDIGLMQINSTHLPRLMRVGITRERLVKEPCTSVRSGAEILAGFIERHGYTWEAVGAYNAGSAPERASLRKAYATKVWREYKELTRERANERARKAAAEAPRASGDVSFD
ncbi:transglycosylase SLT domain-containing protein [Trinickia mobilis]|uniref:transglycosylase SLT domain-containing protein n=1 Tax=Trinickia mobilis TaxID=2816356 RepID=UPI001A8D2C95|nr:transglycosylase SLT domain-containing protein [Trinickia mobilis]